MAGDPFGLLGTVIDGQFRVDQWVGEGGFSIVYKGFHLGLKEAVAIKFLKTPNERLKDVHAEFANRFRDESRIAYRLSQGNLHIVRSITSGAARAPKTSEPVLYMVLEWLDGHSLAEDFRRRRDSHLTGRPLDAVVHLFGPAAEALAHAHAQGVVHRDVKPGNLFLSSTANGPRLKVLDFGMAKILADGALGVSPLAQSIGNVTVFSAPYAAPEQFDPSIAPIGPWTDVYSFALVLLEALTDRRVRTGENLADCLMQACAPNRTPSPRALGVKASDAVDRVFARALSIDKIDRPQDAGEFWGLLKHAMLGDAENDGDRISEPPHDDPATLVHDTLGSMLNDAKPPGYGNDDEPTRTVNLNDLNATARVEGAGPQVPRAVTDFLSHTPAAGRPPEQQPFDPVQNPQQHGAPPQPLGGSNYGGVETDPADTTLPMPPAAALLGKTLPLAASSYAANLPPVPAQQNPAEGAAGQAPYAASGYGALASNQPAGYAALGSQPPAQGNVPYLSPPPKVPRAVIVIAAGVMALFIFGIGSFVVFSVWHRIHTTHAASSQSATTTLAPPPADTIVPAATMSAQPAAIEPAREAVPVVAAPVVSAAPEAVAPAAPPAMTTPPPTPASPPAAAPVRAAPAAPNVVAGSGAPPSVANTPGKSATPAVVDPSAFSATQAQASLRSTESILSSCKRADGPTGAGKIKVVFANDGTVTTSTVTGAPFEGTPVGECVAARFKTAKVHSFEGAPGVVDYTFHINK